VTSGQPRSGRWSTGPTTVGGRYAICRGVTTIAEPTTPSTTADALAHTDPPDGVGYVRLPGRRGRDADNIEATPVTTLTDGGRGGVPSSRLVTSTRKPIR
jgi:hypothetical protein